MKRNLFLSIASITLLSTGLPAHAGSSSDESSRILNDSRRMDSDTPVPQQHTTKAKDSNLVSDIEPEAGHSKNPYDDFTGIYGGAEVGRGLSDDVKGWNSGVFVGYGFEHRFKMFGAYAGIELGHEWSNGEGSTAGVSFEKDHAWIVTLRPGVSVMGDGLGYGIIGYSHAEFESGGDDEYIGGLVLGFGTQFNTGTAFKPRLEYTYTNYEDASIGGTDFAATENTVKLAAVFQF